jgi:hypothetical protein
VAIVDFVKGRGWVGASAIEFVLTIRNKRQTL